MQKIRDDDQLLLAMLGINVVNVASFYNCSYNALAGGLKYGGPILKRVCSPLFVSRHLGRKIGEISVVLRTYVDRSTVYKRPVLRTPDPGSNNCFKIEILYS